MNWSEKECSFEDRFNAGRIPRFIDKHIPKRLDDAGAIEETLVDSDGYWIYLAHGWTSRDGGEDCGIIHCYTIADLREDIATIRKENA